MVIDYATLRSLKSGNILMIYNGTDIETVLILSAEEDLRFHHFMQDYCKYCNVFYLSGPRAIRYDKLIFKTNIAAVIS